MIRILGIERSNFVRTTRMVAHEKGIDHELVADGFCGAAQFNMADCFVLPMLAVASQFPEGREALAGQPRLAAYFERLSQRDSFEATAPSG